MKNKVLIEKEDFYVDMDNKVIVCVLKCNLQLDKNPWSNIIFGFNNRDLYPNMKWNGSFTVRAKTRCSELDTFDIKTGKRIAESRAKVKMFEAAYKFYNYYTDKIKEVLDEFSKMSIACNQALMIENDHVSKLIK